MANVNVIQKTISGTPTDFYYEDTAGRNITAAEQDLTLVAVKNYVKDDLFWYNNLLYKVTAASVSSGATIAITGGTPDAVQTTVSDELKGTADNTTSFTTASTRANIASGETIPTILGKIAKWFTDLADLAFINKPSSGQTTSYLRGDGSWQTLGNGKLTVTVNGTDTEFTANQSTNSSVAFMAPKWHEYGGSVEVVTLTQADTSATFHGLNMSNAYDPYYQTADGTKLTNLDWSIDVTNQTYTVTFDAPTAAQVAGNAGIVMLLELKV